MPTEQKPHRPRRHTIDLSLPPRQRYKALARAYRKHVFALTMLFDSLLADLMVPTSLLPTVNCLSRLLLRRVYDRAQNEELCGIAEEIGIRKYLLVSFNVVLDMLMGCTSGAVRSLEEDLGMLHFRTLDWTMDPLRKVIVQLDFVKTQSSEPLKVLASSITYVGFVGVLTGVRPGLSMSLNFRPVHDATRYRDHFRFYFHHLLVLLGQRPSIASVLRTYLMNGIEDENRDVNTLSSVIEDISLKHTTAAYLVFSNGNRVVSLEKDFATTTLRHSTDFLAKTNHDLDNHIGSQGVGRTPEDVELSGLHDLLEDSNERLACISQKWESEGAISQQQVIKWVKAWPTTNECTHFGAVMDPKAGRVVWAEVYPSPPKGPRQV